MSRRVGQMINSAKLVAGEFSTRHPDLTETLDQHIIDRLFSNCMRCVKQGRWTDTFRLMSELHSYGLKANYVRTVPIFKRSAAQLWRRVNRALAQDKEGARRRGRRKFL